MTTNKPQVIVTCFAGRQSCMRLFIEYVKMLMDKNLVDEFHVWNYAKRREDEAWLLSEFPNHIEGNTIQRKTLSGHSYEDTALTLRTFEDVRLQVKAPHDAHIFLRSKITSTTYEICIGGWGNRRTVIRNAIQGEELVSVQGKLLNDKEFVDVTLSLRDNHLILTVGAQEIAIACDVANPLEVFEIHVSGWINTTTTWQYEDPYDFGRSTHAYKHDKIKLMHIPGKVERRWDEYYKHYNSTRYPNHVIIKADDDITFMDVERFAAYIQNRMSHPEVIVMLPSIVNNELCAFYQQQSGLIPENTVGPMIYAPKGFGPLWRDGFMCQRLHEHFVENKNAWLETTSKLGVQMIKPNDRISINFYAITTRDLFVFQMIFCDDETELTERLPGILNRPHAIDMGFTVAHLAFFKQREEGLDADKVYRDYEALYNTSIHKFGDHILDQ